MTVLVLVATVSMIAILLREAYVKRARRTNLFDHGDGEICEEDHGSGRNPGGTWWM
jgi:hypothetical protein